MPKEYRLIRPPEASELAQSSQHEHLAPCANEVRVPPADLTSEDILTRIRAPRHSGLPAPGSGIFGANVLPVVEDLHAPTRINAGREAPTTHRDRTLQPGRVWPGAATPSATTGSIDSVKPGQDSGGT